MLEVPLLWPSQIKRSSSHIKVKTIALLTAIIVAPACSTDNTRYMYKPDSTVSISQKEQDMFECEVEAIRAVPQDNKLITTPTYTSPVSCNTIGYSTYCSGGNVYGGDVYTIDANLSLRREYESRCLAQRGYLTTQSPIPKCTEDQVPEGFEVTTRTLVHTPVEGACWVSSGTSRNHTLILLPEEQATGG